MDKTRRHLMILVLALCAASPALGDVIELKTGERIQGKSAVATSERVSIEVGGQTLSFDRDKVKGISFDESGAGPAASRGSIELGEKDLMKVAGWTSLQVSMFGVMLNDTRERAEAALKERNVSSRFVNHKERPDGIRRDAILVTMPGDQQTAIVFSTENDVVKEITVAEKGAKLLVGDTQHLFRFFESNTRLQLLGQEDRRERGLLGGMDYHYLKEGLILKPGLKQIMFVPPAKQR